MTAHMLAFARAAASEPAPRKGHTLDDLDPRRFGRRTVIFTPTGGAIDRLLELASMHIRGLAGADVIHRVVSHNPNCLWGIARRDGYDSQFPHAEGFVAFLMLRKEGLRRLCDGTLDRASPDFSVLAPQCERPAAIYGWGIYTPPALVGGVPLVYEKLCSPIYDGISLYSWAATPEGKRFVETIGFVQGAPQPGKFAPFLHFYARGADCKRPAPTYDSYRPGSNAKGATVTVARSFEDLAKVIAVRSSVYMAEQDCPFGEEFDGNDLSATHLIGYVGDEPAGCLRIRYFADFVKMERLAVRHEFRASKLAFKLVRAGIDLCRRKGYRRVYGHVRKDLVRFWETFGFRLIPGKPEFNFSGIAFLEMAGDLAPEKSALRFAGDPYQIIRPEGRWDEPGVLERSSARGAQRMPGEAVP
jgi:predicted GNAT family N-acyltransferase